MCVCVFSCIFFLLVPVQVIISKI